MASCIPNLNFDLFVVGEIHDLLLILDSDSGHVALTEILINILCEKTTFSYSTFAKQKYFDPTSILGVSFLGVIVHCAFKYVSMSIA